ncbi:hypothetical protein [Microvirga zambiensis]|uniref:hypothetical protein n=1 Tax=Microvirga zambiensis TaxID=1402137 RepID=UPI00191F9FA1|nr:hypothetical protein [Microvirga zambiensis]
MGVSAFTVCVVLDGCDVSGAAVGAWVAFVGVGLVLTDVGEADGAGAELWFVEGVLMGASACTVCVTLVVVGLALTDVELAFTDVEEVVVF